MPESIDLKREYAVLALVVDKAEPELLFEVRAAGINQGGEICFPGGRIEAGETMVEAALRETAEEIGLDISKIEIIKPLKYLNQINRNVYPILAKISEEDAKNLKLNPAEVSEVFTAPISFFKTTTPTRASYKYKPSFDADFPFEAFGITSDYRWYEPKTDVVAWNYEGRLIWGMTARLIDGNLNDI